MFCGENYYPVIRTIGDVHLASRLPFVFVAMIPIRYAPTARFVNFRIPIEPLALTVIVFVIAEAPFTGRITTW